MAVNGMDIPSMAPGGGKPSSSIMASVIEKGSGNGKKTFKRLMSYLPAHLWKVILVLILTAVSTTFAVISPQLLGDVTTSLQTTVQAGLGVDFPFIIRTLMILAVMYLACFGLDYLATWIMVGVAQKIIRTLRHEINEKLSRLPLQYYDSHPYGDVMSRATNDVDLVSQTLQTTLSQVVSAAVTIVGITIMMLRIHPLLTVICILTLPAGAIITRSIVQKSQKYFRRNSMFLGKLNGFIEEVFTGHHIVKAFGREEATMADFDADNRQLFKAGTVSQLASGTSYPLNGLVSDLAYIAICGIGGFGVLNGTIPLGDVQAMIQYSQKFSGPIGTLSNITNSIQSAFAGAERVFELLDEPEQIPDEEGALASPTRGAIRFRDVSFSYSPDQSLIEHFNLDVAPGESVAIVGHTGAGKTTLVNLLLRFYDVQEGAIELDGVDIRSVPREVLRSRFGMVLQDAWLFEGTVRENIAYGARDTAADDKALRKAAKASFADGFISGLSEGYDTALKGEAAGISAGQRQLLTIARAVISNPSVLILDEATSSVDTRTEQLLQQAMEQLMQGRTTFIIAHRLSTIRHAKTILVMDEGRIVEQGNHQQLMEKRGVYYELLRAQFEGGE